MTTNKELNMKKLILSLATLMATTQSMAYTTNFDTNYSAGVANEYLSFDGKIYQSVDVVIKTVDKEECINVAKTQVEKLKTEGATVFKATCAGNSLEIVYREKK